MSEVVQEWCCLFGCWWILSLWCYFSLDQSDLNGLGQLRTELLVLGSCSVLHSPAAGSSSRTLGRSAQKPLCIAAPRQRSPTPKALPVCSLLNSLVLTRGWLVVFSVCGACQVETSACCSGTDVGTHDSSVSPENSLHLKMRSQSITKRACTN